MSSLAVLPTRGVQQPRLLVKPEYAGTFGPEAAQFAARYGLVLDPWQRLVLDDWLGFRLDMKWSSSRCGLSVPRQNGKNGVLEVRELFGMVGLGERILHTAHEVKTARKAFKRLQHFFGSEKNDPDAKFPELNALVEEIRSTNGQEAIVLKNGGSIEFVARSKGSARGFTIDVVVMDEAQELADETLDALMPTTRAAPLKNRQLIFTGTPPGEKDNGEVFTRRRQNTIDQKSSRSCWHEWSCADGVDYDDPQAWAQANPALGFRLDAETVQEDRDSLSDNGFARECLGMWSAATSRGPIDATSWGVCAELDSQIVGAPAVAVDIAPDNRVASIGVAGRRADGRPHVEMVENRAGIGWIVDYLVAMNRANRLRCIVIDSGSPAKVLIEPLEAKGLPVRKTDAGYMGTACADIYRKVMSGELAHIDQPTLNTAVADVRKRNIGSEGLWGWNRKNTESDITPMVAVTLAQHAIDAPMPKPKHSVSTAVYGFN
ncbi:hypothetical protein GS913_06425 [Rhodococcus hoagii]|nr:hypothetical protein [Prescottella equi]NKW17068.1 hypothetical protein [Prescottella equi]NKZ94870.1 hypothetical protein [Prescottella equi]